MPLAEYACGKNRWLLYFLKIENSIVNITLMMMHVVMGK
jgi:hypothetical protein